MEGSWSLNPFCWSKRAIRVFTSGFFLIMLPVYLYLGFQPALPAEALNYPTLSIPEINLDTPVAPLELSDRQLIAPDNIAGIYSQNENKQLIIGHSSTVFKRLHKLQPGDEFTYNDTVYRVISAETFAKADIDMRGILAPADQDTIIIMTCAGTPLPDHDATHRLIVTATSTD